MANNNTKPRAKWTVMIYMAADDEPSFNASIDFNNELLEIGRDLDNMEDKEKINILLQVYMDWNTEKGQLANYRTRRYEIKTDYLFNKPKMELKPEVSMGNSSSLTNFIKWCKKNYEAEKYLLLLWGHGTGSGLFSTELEANYAELKQKRPDCCLTDVNSGQRVTLPELLKQDSPFFKSLSTDSKETKIRIEYTDENNQKFSDILTATKTTSRVFRNKPKFFLRFNNPSTINKLRSDITTRSNLDGLIGKELDKSLEKAFGARGKIDLVVIMGCCLQMVEFGYEIRKHCRYYVASEELIFFEGYNYIRSFSDLLNHPEWDGRELAKNFIIKTPRKDDYNKEEKGYLAISSVDLEKSNHLFKEINAISRELNNNFDEFKELIKEARLKCSHFGELSYRYSFIDIIWFLESLSKILKSKKLHTKLRKKIDRLSTFLEKKYIIKNFIGKRKVAKPRQERTMGGHGVGIYFPSSNQDQIDDEERGKYFNREEKAFVNTFSEKNNWNRLIFGYMKIVPGDIPEPVIIDAEDKRLFNLLDDNNRLRELITEYV